jgi:hypothetical protein
MNYNAYKSAEISPENRPKIGPKRAPEKRPENRPENPVPGGPPDPYRPLFKCLTAR